MMGVITTLVSVAITAGQDAISESSSKMKMARTSVLMQVRAIVAEANLAPMVEAKHTYTYMHVSTM